jgi:hypothetical protein
MDNKREIRSVPDIELRGEGEGKTLAGYAAVYNSPATIKTPFGDFDEVVRSGAFKNCLARGDDVVAWFNHGDNPMPLGRRAANTLRVFEDSHGLAFELDLPDTQIGRDVAVGVRRGDIRGMSFAFGIPEGGDCWTKRDDHTLLRELVNIDLFDVSPVVWPAYQDTSVALRSAGEVLQAHLETEPALRQEPVQEPEPVPEPEPVVEPEPVEQALELDELTIEVARMRE